MKVTVAVAVVSASLPAGVTAGLLRLAIVDSIGTVVQQQDVSGTSADFDGLSAGDYTATAQRLDSTGAPLGDAVASPFTVPSDGSGGATGTYDAPQSITVTVG
ncbi:hypothetical protein QCE62_06975 [Caballeronia sp. LZ033]|uniref:hypothetical protein n=1 Tax=Caballeronia sp. LZ033 TaxID=3038566 RepID=UPI002856B853|nr:hypothetical protein [Caballeronia sp. LZ033]MDR5813334.1 hypothetical protein [Caballeronia sp. LZ033]